MSTRALTSLSAKWNARPGTRVSAKTFTGSRTGLAINPAVLIRHGESDVLILVSEAHEFFGEIAYSDKTLRIYPRGTPGCAHCQLDAIGTAQRHL